ncbi:glycerophosphodiester phosphodiesterase family protein [Irregularibacter muris]|nr:glycerophosphodiester phosphodiesterase family protein [Irregularibacter muris]
MILGIMVLYLWMIMPKMINRPDMRAFKKYFAHRGLHQDNSISPENSMTAFALAVEKGYGIELDVQLSKDGLPVVFHDESLKRVCGIDKKVKDLTFQELRKLYLLTSQETIPHLQEVLDLVDGKVPLIIELKGQTRDISLCTVVAHYLDQYPGRYCIESFNPLMLRWFKRNRPQVIRGQLSSDFVKSGDTGGDKRLYFLLKHLLLNILSKPNFIAYNHLYHHLLSFKVCRGLYKIPTVAWTIKSVKELQESKKDFDHFIFENFIP